MSALRHDAGKPTFHHLHPQVLAELAGSNGRLSLSYFLAQDMIQWFFFRKPLCIDLPTLANAAPVLDFGAKKYASLNYTEGMLYSRVFNSWFRHSYIYDQDQPDAESGLPHSGHAACNVLFAYTYQILDFDGGSFDDRPKLDPIQLPTDDL